jgi:pilus assembly protein TadC
MKRKQTESEKAYLEDLLAKLPTAGRRTKEAVENFFVLLAVSTLLGVLVWASLAWLVRKVSDLEIGWDSEYAIPVIVSLLTLSAVYAVYSTAQWMRSWPDHRQPLRDNLIAGFVTEAPAGT